MLAENQLMDQSPETDGAFLGVSLGTPYYSKERIRQYLAWAERHHLRFSFLVGDEIFAYTHSVLRYLPLKAAYARAVSIGDDLEVFLTRESRRMGIDARVFRWKNLRKRPEYRRILAMGRCGIIHDSGFRSRVHEEVWRNLGDRLHVADICRSAGCSHVGCRRLDCYVLHEIAGLITMSEYIGYPTEIYPGPDVSIIPEIYDGLFGSFQALLPELGERRFKTIRI